MSFSDSDKWKIHHGHSRNRWTMNANGCFPRSLMTLGSHRSAQVRSVIRRAKDGVLWRLIWRYDNWLQLSCLWRHRWHWLASSRLYFSQLSLGLHRGRGLCFISKGGLPHGSAITICQREPGHVSRDLWPLASDQTDDCIIHNTPHNLLPIIIKGHAQLAMLNSSPRSCGKPG